MAAVLFKLNEKFSKLSKLSFFFLASPKPRKSKKRCQKRVNSSNVNTNERKKAKLTNDINNNLIENFGSTQVTTNKKTKAAASSLLRSKSPVDTIGNNNNESFDMNVEIKK